jgi:hypothetical protein
MRPAHQHSTRAALLAALAAPAALAACRPAPRPAEVAPAPEAVLICPQGTTAVGGTCQPAPEVAVGVARTPEPAPAPERPRAGLELAEEAATASELMGVWRGNDNLGAALYNLSLLKSGAFVQDITTLDPSSGRPPGTCHQAGSARLEGKLLSFTFDENDCNTSFIGGTDAEEIVKHNRGSFTVKMGGYTIEYTRLR